MLRAATRFAARSRQEWRGLSTASLAALVLGLATCPARALDIYQWEWVDPTDLSKGIRQSSRLCPGGANVSLQPGTASYGKDLTMAYLPGADLKGATWSSAKLFMADLVGANLEGANLGGTNLSYAILGNANLARARFLEADLSNAYLTGADLTGADLECQLQNADFTNAKIAGATIGTYCGGPQTSSYTAAQLYSTASYQTHDLHGISISGDMTGWNLANQNLSQANFRSANLTDANLVKANLSGASWTGSYLTGADLKGASFNWSQIANTSLQRMDLRATAAPSASELSTLRFINTIQSNGDMDSLLLIQRITERQTLQVRDYPDDFSGPRPGIHVHGMARLEQGNELRFVITGKTWNSTISFDANIPVILGGTLELAFAPDVDPASWAGRSLQLFDWTGVTLSGRFDTVSQGNLTWDTSQLYTTGFVTLVPEPAPAALLALGGLALLRRHRHSTLWPN